MAYGGWGALKSSQDHFLMQAVSVNHPSVYVAQPIQHYRIHDQQNTRQPTAHGRRIDQMHQLIAARTYAMRVLGGTVLSNTDYTYIPHGVGEASQLPIKFTQS